MISLKAVIQRSVQRGGGTLALWVVEADNAFVGVTAVVGV